MSFPISWTITWNINKKSCLINTYKVQGENKKGRLKVFVCQSWLVPMSKTILQVFLTIALSTFFFHTKFHIFDSSNLIIINESLTLPQFFFFFANEIKKSSSYCIQFFFLLLTQRVKCSEM